MKRIPNRLPSVELEENMQFYKRAVEDYEKLEASIVRVLENKQELFEKYHPLVAEMKVDRLQCELNDVRSKIRIQTQNFEIYETRVEQYGPILAKETKMTNDGWDALWEEASLISRKFPSSGLAQVMNGYPKEQYNPDLFSQELKNEAFKAIRQQLASYHAQIKNAKDSGKTKATISI